MPEEFIPTGNEDRPPEIAESGLIPDEPDQAPENEITNVKNESMETHAEHLHKVPGKGYWHFVFEFFMLFLAVFCGFLAEYLLEYKLDREKEKEFIVSLVNELKADNLEINGIQAEKEHYLRLDTLARTMLGDNFTPATVRECYRLYMSSSEMGPYAVFKRSTLTQLKSGGNMRLIRNSSVVDTILKIDGAISHIIDLQQLLEKTIYDNKRFAPEIFDLGHFINNKEWTNIDEVLNSGKTFTFLTNDRVKLKKFGTYMLFHSGNLRVYLQFIDDYRVYSNKMIDYFSKEYNLGEAG